MIHGKFVYTVQEAAYLLNLSESMCYRLIRDGRLRATLHPGQSVKMVTARAIDQYLEGMEEIAKGA